MTDKEHPDRTPREFDVTKAGALTLHNRGIGFAVGGMGEVLRYSDGVPIDGKLIEDTVNRSGQRLTNAEAAGQIIASREFVDKVETRLAEINSANTAPTEDTGLNL